MNKPVLVVMAAGMGSRYGGMKQIDPVGPNGQVIVDYSLYDARRAGFETVIFVIKHEIEDAFKAAIGERVSKAMNVKYAFQQLDELPAGFAVPEGRVKPWGTCHAVLAAKDLIDGPFAVINADDYYGPEAFRVMYDYLSTHEDGSYYDYCMVSYLLRNTVSENGSVARGVCVTEPDGTLHSVTERTRIETYENGVHFTEDGGASWTDLPGDTPVSMNLWGFGKSFLDEAEQRFAGWLTENLPKNPLKCEYFLPLVVTELIEEGKAKIQVLRSTDKWYGVTYREDKPLVVEALSREGSLTIVGDVKQAIYGWRGGEAALFDLVPEDAALRRLAPAPEILSLDRNWRSREEVVAWNNAVFSQLGDKGRAREILSLMLPAATDAALLDDAAAMLAAAFADAEQQAAPGKSGGVVRLRALPTAPAGEDGVAVVETLYELPAVKATLALTYRINGAGEMEVTERMTADKTAEGPNLFRFGMTLTMPARYDRVIYYGRGAHENYADRLSSADLGLYEQRVADQYHDEYVRPQESGTKGGLRWWTVVDSAGTGLTILADAPFSASALPYATADLDVSNFPPQQHSGTLVARDATFVNFDLRQSGLGCIDSWGALPEEQFRVPYGDYTFRFMLKPTVK